jgi:hypothetical protein
VKNPVSKFAFQVHNLRRYAVEGVREKMRDGASVGANGGALQVESSLPFKCNLQRYTTAPPAWRRVGFGTFHHTLQSKHIQFMTASMVQ